MPSKLPRITVRLETDIYKKLIKLSALNDRTVSQEARRIIRNHIQNYERTNGEIKID